jgi:asparagine synthase (glutamine-hydrolysing)
MDLHFELFPAELRSAIRRARETYSQLIQTHPLSFAVFRQAPWHHHGLSALEQTQITVRSPFLDNDIVRTVFRAPDSSLTSEAACLRLIDAGEPRLGRIRTDRGPMHRGLWPAARRAGIELTRKAEYASDYGMPQWIVPIDRLLAGVPLERLFLGRHKFFHFRLWYRDLLSRYVRDTLLDPLALSRSYVEPARVKSLVDSHTAGRGNYTLEIHKLLTLELIHRLFLDAQPVRETVPVPLQIANAC